MYVIHRWYSMNWTQWIVLWRHEQLQCSLEYSNGHWLCIKSIIKSLIVHMYLLFLFGFFIIIDVHFSNEISFNVSIGFWSLNELFQKLQRRNSEQRIEEKFSWRLKQILVQISAPNLPQKTILFQLNKKILHMVDKNNPF
jgi:hypothetical protein